MLLAELRAVLARQHLASRLARQRSSVEEAITLYGALAVSVSPLSVPRVVPDDADDDHVIAAAVSAQAKLIVSGDRHLLTLGRHENIPIVTPAEAVRLIGLPCCRNCQGSFRRKDLRRSDAALEACRIVRL